VRPTTAMAPEDAHLHRPEAWPGTLPPAPTPERPGRKVVGRTSLIVALALALAFASVSAVAFVFDHNISGKLSKTRASLAATQSTLATTQTDLAKTQSQLSATKAALAQARAHVNSLNSQVRGLESRLSDAQSILHATQQVTEQVATVAGSLKSCVDATQIFEADFTTELSTGFYSSVVTDEATRADAACAQANSDYRALMSELSLAGATTA